MAATRSAKPSAKKRPAKRARKEAPAAPPPAWQPTAPPPVPAPQTEQNQWAMFAHLAAFASVVVPLGNIVGPLVVWQIKKQWPYVAQHGKEALNFQISMTLYALVVFALAMAAFFTSMFGTAATMRPEPMIGLFLTMMPLMVLALAFTVFNIVMVIIAALRANSGWAFRYPLSIRFVK